MACSSSSEAGVEATLMLSSVGEPPMRDGVRSFYTDRGYQVQLSAGFLVLEHLELQPCVDGTALARMWAPAVAFAHTGGNPRRLAAPVLVDLTQRTREFELGSIKPPAGRYCAFQQSLGPSDADTPGVSPDRVGQSLRLELLVSGGTLDESREVSLVSDSVFDGFYPLEPMLLDDAHRHVTLQIAHTGVTWFDGIDFATADDERVLQKFLRNFRDSVEVSWR
ncbi:MAG: hypothetical protein R3B89_16360 [Polyangiaceae bacterium]